MKKALIAILFGLVCNSFADNTNSIVQNLQELIEARDAITNAIVQKGGTVTSGALKAVPAEIESIPSGAILGTATFTSNATYQASADGVDGYSQVTVNIPQADWFKGMVDRTVSGSLDLTGLNITEVARNAFSFCSSLESISLPDTVVSVGRAAFQQCNGLQYANIGNSVTNLGQSAFVNCDALISITIPDGVTTIENYTFQYCTSLETIDFGTTRSTIPTLGNINAFMGLPANYQILVPSALLTDWKAANNWKHSDIVDHIVAHP